MLTVVHSTEYTPGAFVVSGIAIRFSGDAVPWKVSPFGDTTDAFESSTFNGSENASVTTPGVVESSAAGSGSDDTSAAWARAGTAVRRMAIATPIGIVRAEATRRRIIPAAIRSARRGVSGA